MILFCFVVVATSSELDNDKEDRTKRSAEEIITDLEATLNETAEELEQQKRLNQALLRRKVHLCNFAMFLLVSLFSCPFFRHFGSLNN